MTTEVTDTLLARARRVALARNALDAALTARDEMIVVAAEQGMTITDIANLAGVSRQTIHRVMKDHRR